MRCIAVLATQLALSVYLEELRAGTCSLAPQLPCIFTVEQGLWAARLALSLLELTLGLRLLRKLIREQSARFFVALEADFDDLSAPQAAGAPRARVYGRPERLHAD